jgi:hypothetical protein
MILMFDPLIRLQQEISEASDDASRKYYEETPEKDRTGSGVTEVMRAAAKSKQQSFKGQFSKFTAVANPKFGDAFMDEVSLLILRASQFPLKYC